MSWPLWMPVALAVLLLVLTALVETASRAVWRVSPSRAAALAREGVRRADELLRLVSPLPRTLAVLSLLTTMLRVGYVILLAVIGIDLLGEAGGLILAAVVAVLTLYMAAHVVPAVVVHDHPERVAVRLVGVMRLPVAVLGPLAQAMGRVGRVFTPGNGDDDATVVTAGYLRDLVDLAVSEGTLTTSRHAMLTGVLDLDLDDTVVRKIMVPRPDMVTVAAAAPLDEVVEVVLDAGHSRIPVHGDDRDEIVGIVYAKDVLALLHTGDVRPWTDVMRRPLVVPELKSIEGLLRELQTEQVHMAVVVDEYGATVGVVTIEDILEELVGEIVDEYDDELPLVEVLDDERWRVDARLPVNDLAELVDTRLPADKWDTVGGLLFGMLGHIARPGEHVAVDGVQLTAEQVRGRRISQVLVERCDMETP